MKTGFAVVVSALLAAGYIPATTGQEPVFMEAATQPGRAQAYGRLQLLARDGRGPDGQADRVAARVKLAYGLRSSLAFLLDADTCSARAGEGGGRTTGLAVWTPRLKYRFWQSDLGPLNTWRAGLLAGADIPGPAADLAPAQVSPRAGLATTAILGRHGLNGQVDGAWTADDAFRLAANASHLYRLHPAAFAARSAGAWYTVLESLNDWTDAGDWRFDAAAGLLFEARRWEWELGLRAPLARTGPDDDRLEAETGWRYLF